MRMPTITELIPAAIALDEPAFTLRVRGTGFIPESLILWDGDEVTTIYHGETELTTDVDPSDAVIATEIPVQVLNAVEPDETAATSNVYTFKFDPPFARGA
jgi:hypothetical protein